MKLTREESAILNGEMGKAAQEAIKYQIEVGNFFEAKRFVPISNAHLMGDIEVMGDAGFEYLKQAALNGAHCSVPTSSNAQCMHFEDIPNIKQDETEIDKERKIIHILKSMNVATTDTCINYQTVYQPKLGEHVAWGDTGTVIYANSVFGARTNYESGYSSFAASITGRTPDYGFHLDEYRKGRIAVLLKTKPKDLADWGAIGKIVGHPHQDYSAVPVFLGIDEIPNSDSLKHLGASLASYGSMAMYHVVGVTPEAQTASIAFGNKKPEVEIEISDEDIEAVYRSYKILEGKKTLVVFSGPQQSIFEMRRLAEMFSGKKVSDDIELIITTNRAVYNDAKSIGYVDSLEKAGATIMQGVCFYILQRLSKIREENDWVNLVSNSAKLVNTITAHRFNTILRRTNQCVEIALSGKLK